MTTLATELRESAEPIRTINIMMYKKLLRAADRLDELEKTLQGVELALARDENLEGAMELILKAKRGT